MVSALPSLTSQVTFVMCWFIRSFEMFLVNELSGFSARLIFLNESTRLSFCYCSHSTLVARCLILPMPCLCITPRAAHASTCILTLACHLKSLIIARISMDSVADLTVAYNSLSADDNAIKDCCLLHPLIKCETCTITPPEV